MRPLFVVALALLSLAACDNAPKSKKSGRPPALITVTPVSSGSFEVIEETLGTLETLADPKLAAEIAGRVTQVRVYTGQSVKAGDVLAVIDAGDITLSKQADEAELRRLDALLAQQDKLVARQQTLVAKGFLSKNAGEDVAAQRAALFAQRDAALARAEASQRNLGKTQVRAPIDAVIETQIVTPGDYVKLGDPLFQLLAEKKLRAHLPFPESAASWLKKGMTVRLSSPTAPGKVYETSIFDIRPGIIAGSRSLDVLVNVENDGALRGGGTVNASVSLASKSAALTVPEQSVVLRPAGKVVYVISEGSAQQRVITAGAKREGRIEILDGLKGDEIVALDGAGFLTDKATVSIKDAAKVGAGGTATAADKSAK